jgi:hypothetical protein
MFELDVKDMMQFPKLTTSLMGTISHRFSNISSLHYQQLDVVTFHQMKIEKTLTDVSDDEFSQLVISYFYFFQSPTLE